MIVRHILSHPAITLPALFAGLLLLLFAANLASEDQRHYVDCLAQHQAPAYCRLVISGR